MYTATVKLLDFISLDDSASNVSNIPKSMWTIVHNWQYLVQQVAQSEGWCPRNRQYLGLFSICGWASFQWKISPNSLLWFVRLYHGLLYKHRLTSFTAWISNYTLLLTGLTLIPAWINIYIHFKVWDEITYPFPNFKGHANKSLRMDK